MPRTDAARRPIWPALALAALAGCKSAQPHARRTAPVPEARASSAELAPRAAALAAPPAAALPSTAAESPERRLCRRAVDAYERTGSFVARLRRRETVNGETKPLETMVFKFRKQPLSVHLKWVGPVGQGREVVYVEGRHDGKMHVRTAAGDVPFVPAGRQMAFAPDSPLVRKNSRHDIRDSGPGGAVRQFRDLVAAADAGGAGPVYLGQVQRPEFAGPVEGVEWPVPAGREPQLPAGGKRQVYFDPATGLPGLILTFEGGREVEYYCFDRYELPVNLDDRDFDPAVLWR